MLQGPCFGNGGAHRPGEHLHRRREVDPEDVHRKRDHVAPRAALPAEEHLLAEVNGEPVITAASRAWTDQLAAHAAELQVTAQVLDAHCARAVEVDRGDQCGPCRGDRESHARDRRHTTCDGPPRRAGRDYSAVRTVRFPQEDYPREGPGDLVALVRQDRPLASVSGHADS